MKEGNIFTSIPSEIEKEVFNTLLDKGSLKIERILSKGHTSPEEGWYDQAQDEWVIVLQGGATIEYEQGESRRLGVGDFVEIPANTKHKVAWTNPDEITVWLAVHYQACTT
ncbi:MAG: cupin domain-containing protein [Pseudomonadota bacterium]